VFKPEIEMSLTDVVIQDDDRVAPQEYRALRKAVGWPDPTVKDADLTTALQVTWNVSARTSEGELVGLARVLDDGALYASLWDVIVAPGHRRTGLGTQLFDRALKRVADRSLVALVGTAEGTPIYTRAGFVPKDQRSTGMFRRK
jgi:predicted GNAT family N-acyltransferase